MSDTEREPDAIGPANLRLLKWNERVNRGDFVKDGRSGFVPWEGPNGFRADAFIKRIYRRREAQPVGTIKE
jgi:hypothetical protein